RAYPTPSYTTLFRSRVVPASLHAAEDFEALLDTGDGQDVEFVRGDSGDHLVAEHQVLHVFHRDDDALAAGEAFDAADVEETFDLLVHGADGLDIALLVD